MGFGKSSSFLAFSILVLCQASSFQAAPLRSSLESLPDLTTLNEKEERLLLAALVNAYAQKVNELEEEQGTHDSSLDTSKAKRCSKLSTCLLGAYLKKLSDMNKYAGIDFGEKSRGKKRDLVNNLEKVPYPQSGGPQDAN